VNAVYIILTCACVSISGVTFVASTLAAGMQLGARCIWTAAAVIVDTCFFACTQSWHSYHWAPRTIFKKYTVDPAKVGKFAIFSWLRRSGRNPN